MAVPDITVEDGTIVADANSYATIAQADAFQEANPHGSAWAALSADRKRQCLITGTLVLDALISWKGARKKPDEQVLAWPRIDTVAADDEVPEAVRQATSEVARLLDSSDLTADSDQDLLKSVGLGSGAVSVVFRDNKSTPRLPYFIRALLSRYATTTGSSLGFARVHRT